jgi:hypothetical protein
VNKLIVGFGSLVLTHALLTAPALAWHTERQDVEYTGKQVFSAPVEVNSSLSVAGTQLTASAARLNAVGEYYVTWNVDGVTAVAVNTNTATQALTASAPLLVVTASGSTNTHVYASTLGNPPAAGYVVRIAAAASSNSVSFLDAANLNLAGGYTVSVGRVLTLVGQTATNWLEVSRSSN